VQVEVEKRDCLANGAIGICPEDIVMNQKVTELILLDLLAWGPVKPPLIEQWLYGSDQSQKRCEK